MVTMQYRKVADIAKLEGNPRKIDKEDMARLKQSIEGLPDYFEAHPIVLSDRTGKLVVIDGNQRLEAARQLGWEEIPTALLSGLSEEKEREIIIRANVNNGEWDMDLLQEWDKEQLEDWGVDMPEWEEEKQQSQKDLSDELNFDYKLEITCNDEVEQQSLFNEFQERGIVCRILTL
jgi:ParB-like chromosome segregation protein Spo0J